MLDSPLDAADYLDMICIELNDVLHRDSLHGVVAENAVQDYMTGVETSLHNLLLRGFKVQHYIDALNGAAPHSVARIRARVAARNVTLALMPTSVLLERASAHERRAGPMGRASACIR